MEHVQPYKTAAELGIEEWERDGLIALVGPLSRGELQIDMHQGQYCGSAACIGGWVAFHAEQKSFDCIMRAEGALERLYFPALSHYADGGCWKAWRATAEQAAHAIVNFLTLGDPHWGDVMREVA